MKKVLSIICLFLAIGVNAQSVDVDRIETDGRHQIMTKTKTFKIGKKKYYFGLKLYEEGYSQDWLLLVSSFHIIPDNSVLLMKLGNDEILTLPVNNVNEGEVHTGGYVYNIGNVGYVSPQTSVNYYVSLYELTQNDLDKIEAHGISKVRLGSLMFYDEKVWKNNALGKHITKSRKSILKRLDNPKIKKTKNKNSIFDDF